MPSRPQQVSSTLQDTRYQRYRYMTKHRWDIWYLRSWLKTENMSIAAFRQLSARSLPVSYSDPELTKVHRTIWEFLHWYPQFIAWAWHLPKRNIEICYQTSRNLKTWPANCWSALGNEPLQSSFCRKEAVDHLPLSLRTERPQNPTRYSA